MEIRWDEPSLQILHRLAERFPDELVAQVAEGLLEVARSHLVPEARARAPRFEGTLAQDIGVHEGPLVRGGLVALHVGESGRLFTFTEGDPVYGPDPFSYPLAKHEGADAHVVSIYARDGGPGSMARAKLRRYYRRIVGGLPETQEELEERNRAGDPRDRISPFLTVRPSRSARPFLADLVTGVGAATTTRLLNTYLRRTIERIWQ